MAKKKTELTYEEHLQKIVGLTLAEADRAIRAAVDLWFGMRDVLSESYIEKFLKSSDTKVERGLINIMFRLTTGCEEDFDDFYSSFNAPGTDHGEKPVAWGVRFLPDLMMDAFLSRSMSLKEKKKAVLEAYDGCITARAEFRKKKMVRTFEEKGTGETTPDDQKSV